MHTCKIFQISNTPQNNESRTIFIVRINMVLLFTGATGGTGTSYTIYICLIGKFVTKNSRFTVYI